MFYLKTGFGRLSRKIKKIFSPQAVILLYHRVLDAQSDPQLMCVNPKNFTNQIEYLKKNYQIISLSELAAHLQAGSLPKRAVVLTFDDGYKDNLVNAKPVLDNFGVPATVFVAADYIGYDKEFWWDALENIILLTNHLPPVLEIKTSNKNYVWSIDSLLSGVDKTWDISKPDCSGRHLVYKELYNIFLRSSLQERAVLLDYLYQWVGKAAASRPDYLALNREELCQMSEGGLIEIGSHGLSHSNLSCQPNDIKKNEIQLSKQTIEGIINRQVSSFAYPFGYKADIKEDLISFVREAGYKVACGNFPGNVYAGSDRFLLGRHIVRNWDVKSFSFQLKRFFNG
jgi:peptidoglycan/xylan/chitin deacetylase (PgdA/CDA1 family)